MEGSPHDAPFEADSFSLPSDQSNQNGSTINEFCDADDYEGLDRDEYDQPLPGYNGSEAISSGWSRSDIDIAFGQKHNDDDESLEDAFFEKENGELMAAQASEDDLNSVDTDVDGGNSPTIEEVITSVLPAQSKPFAKTNLTLDVIKEQLANIRIQVSLDTCMYCGREK